MFVSKRRGGSRNPSFHGTKLQTKINECSETSSGDCSDYVEEVVYEDKGKEREKFSLGASIAAKANYFKVGLIDGGIFGDEPKEKRARSDFMLGGIQAMMEPESGEFSLLASSARRRLLHDGLPFVKSYIKENGYLMESPPLSGFKAHVDSIEPLYHHMSSALWTIPAFNMRLIEKATPSYISGATTEVAYNLLNAAVDMAITGVLAPASLFYLGMHCLSTRPGEMEEED